MYVGVCERDCMPFVFRHVHVCMGARGGERETVCHVCTGAHGGQKAALDPLYLEL